MQVWTAASRRLPMHTHSTCIIEQLCAEYSDIVSTSHLDAGCTHLIEVDIDTGDWPFPPPSSLPSHPVACGLASRWTDQAQRSRSNWAVCQPLGKPQFDCSQENHTQVSTRKVHVKLTPPYGISFSSQANHTQPSPQDWLQNRRWQKRKARLPNQRRWGTDCSVLYEYIKPCLFYLTC